MYNRYVPGHDGSYRRHTVADAPIVCSNPEPPSSTPCEEKTQHPQAQRSPCRNTPNGFDLGDLLLLCIVVLLLIDSEDDDSMPLLIMAAAFLLLQ